MAYSKLPAIPHIRGVLLVGVVWPLLVVINVTQMASLVLLPLSRRAFRAYNRGCANLWWGLCARSVEVLYGAQAEIVGDDLPDRENVVLISNHQTMGDIQVLFFLARSKHRLGDLKWFVKDPIKYVPGIGWGMLFLACIFVKRNWTADRAGIERTFATVIGEDLPLWVVSFSEGTRRTAAKVAISKRYAQKASLTPTDHVMVPRTKGFVATVTGLREHCDAVYDVTIGYPGPTPPSVWEMACGTAKRFTIHVKRYPMSDLPHSDDLLSGWLIARFLEKDERMAVFTQTGRFPEDDADPQAATPADPVQGKRETL